MKVTDLEDECCGAWGRLSDIALETEVDEGDNDRDRGWD